QHSLLRIAVHATVAECRPRHGTLHCCRSSTIRLNRSPVATRSRLDVLHVLEPRHYMETPIVSNQRSVWLRLSGRLRNPFAMRTDRGCRSVTRNPEVSTELSSRVGACFLILILLLIPAGLAGQGTIVG